MNFPLPEMITVWVSTGNDGLGGNTWTVPIAYPARIAYSQTKFTDNIGDTATSTAVCYTEAPITMDTIREGVQVLFGSSSEAAPPADANDVRAMSQTPSGAGDLKKLWFA